MDNEFVNNTSCPVKDLLYLIQQDDIEKIREALLDVIDRSHPGCEIYLYEQGYSLYESKDREFSPVLLACRGNESCKKDSQDIFLPSGVESINFDGFKYLPTDNVVQVFTVESEHSNRGLLITVNKDVINEEYINALLAAYNHQTQLLRNKDTDSLTGLLNRQSFDLKLSKLHTNISYENRTQDESSGYYFALLDIDFFKSINDKYGHVYGDEVLILFSNVMKKTFRDSDMLFRYGGEEFCVLLSHINQEQAKSILDRFRVNVENYNFPMEDGVTVSIGYCEFTNRVLLTSITEQADKALYYSKEHGRNKTSSYEKLLAENKIQTTIIDENDIEIF